MNRQPKPDSKKYTDLISEIQKGINQAFAIENKKLKNQKRDQQLKHAMAGFFGLISGKLLLK